jgi:hypothetical protein
MVQSTGETTERREMFEVPDWLAERTREQQAKAPYWGLGFKRGRLDADIHEAMLSNLQANKSSFLAETSIDEIGTVNSDFFPALYHEDKHFNQIISEALKPGHEAWSGLPMTDSACYGFRAYQRGTYLHNHVDRTSTHLISSTICVDHQLQEPWPLYLEDVDGNPHKVNLEPGEYLLYEGAQLLHGRPWPLVGDYYIGMFVHYRPVGLEL